MKDVKIIGSNLTNSTLTINTSFGKWSFFTQRLDEVLMDHFKSPP